LRQSPVLRAPVFPYTTLVRSRSGRAAPAVQGLKRTALLEVRRANGPRGNAGRTLNPPVPARWLGGGEGMRCNAITVRPDSRSCRSEEHTSELQSRENLVCRLL